jgi:4-carboxymuconolactone decarboxylase
MNEQTDLNAGETGRAVIRELMGEEFLQRRDARRNSFNGIVQDYSDEVCFGRVWSRKGIDHKQRSIINIAMLVALNRLAPLRTHVEGALNNGCTVEELQEILLQAAVYCGLPAAVDAFRVAEEILKARGMLE